MRHFDETADDRVVTSYCTKRIPDKKAAQFIINTFRDSRKELAP